MDYDPELSDDLQAIEILADMGYLDRDKPEYGITQLYLHKGLSALSNKQQYIFNTIVAPAILRSCARCGEGIELSALPNAYEEGLMLCSYHMHKHHKDE